MNDDDDSLLQTDGLTGLADRSAALAARERSCRNGERAALVGRLVWARPLAAQIYTSGEEHAVRSEASLRFPAPVLDIIT